MEIKMYYYRIIYENSIQNAELRTLTIFNFTPLKDFHLYFCYFKHFIYFKSSCKELITIL